MNLTQEQIAQYKDQGVLLIPECFSQKEILLMHEQINLLMAEDSPGRVLEKDKKTVRALHGCHSNNKFFSDLTRNPRLLNPISQLLDSPVYVYQFKMNLKAAFHGDVWPWHQDFIYWHEEDGLPSPNIINVVIFIDEVNEFNGPIYFIPGSQKQGMMDVEAPAGATSESNNTGKNQWSVNFSSDLKYCPPLAAIAQLAEKEGIIAPKGPAGSVLLFDSNVVHSSAPNISPFPRRLMIITYNSVENIPIPPGEPRPEFLVSRDYTPLLPLSDSESLLFSTADSGRAFAESYQ